MGMFFKFKCWGCDESPCICEHKDKTEVKEELIYSLTEPVVTRGDMIMQNDEDYFIISVDAETRVAYKLALETGGTTQLQEPYKIIGTVINE